MRKSKLANYETWPELNHSLAHTVSNVWSVHWLDAGVLLAVARASGYGRTRVQTIVFVLVSVATYQGTPLAPQQTQSSMLVARQNSRMTFSDVLAFLVSRGRETYESACMVLGSASRWRLRAYQRPWGRSSSILVFGW